jgi:hypothetical protein
MTEIEDVCRSVCEATEFVTIVTMGDDGPHVVGNWGDYMRAFGINFGRNRGCGKGKISLGARRHGHPRRGYQNSIVVMRRWRVALFPKKISCRSCRAILDTGRLWSRIDQVASVCLDLS